MLSSSVPSVTLLNGRGILFSNERNLVPETSEQESWTILIGSWVVARRVTSVVVVVCCSATMLRIVCVLTLCVEPARTEHGGTVGVLPGPAQKPLIEENL